MAVARMGNWLGSMRVDVPHLRLLESAVAGDFQALSGTLMAGTRALVAWGATILDVGTVGTPSSSLLLRMASAVLLHATAAEPGAVFTVDSAQPDDTLNGTNSRVIGSFTPGVHQVNYVSLDLIRLADPTTQDAVVFRSASTDAEFTQVVPLGRVLQYRIHITTSDFGTTPSYCPIAKVVVDANGNVEQVIDARQMFWRLGLGGTTPNALAQYVWSNRNEVASASAFSGGDKDIRSQSDFNRAAMQRLWELGGGEHWYSPADDRSVQLTYDNSAVFPVTGENWDWTSIPGTLQWRGLRVLFGNSTATYNLVADGVNPNGVAMVDGDVLYIDLNRSVEGATITPIKSTRSGLYALALTTPGARHILAWCYGTDIYVDGQPLRVNAGIVHATNTSFGTVKLFTAFGPSPTNPVVPVMDAVFSAVAADPANVVARGITRDVAGILRLGTGANDTSIYMAAAGVLSTIFGTLQVDQGIVGTSSGAASTPGVYGVGVGTNFGVRGDGSGAAGVFGLGAATFAGVVGNGTTSGPGIFGTGGATGFGVYGVGGATSGTGVVGNGTGNGAVGVAGTGGPTSGTGVTGTGGSTDGIGVSGTGVGAGVGVVGVGGTTSGTGVTGTGGATNGVGVYGAGAGAGAGMVGVGGAGLAGAGHGLRGTGGAAPPGVVGGNGVEATGGNGAASGGVGGGHGVHGTAGTTTSGAPAHGVVGDGAASGTTGSFGVKGTGGPASTGVYGVGGATSGTGVEGHGTGTGAGVLGASSGGTGPGGSFVGNATRAALHLGSVTADPTNPVDGDVWIRTDTAPPEIRFRVGALTYRVPGINP